MNRRMTILSCYLDFIYKVILNDIYVSRAEDNIMELTKDIVALGNESTSIAKKRSAQAVMDKIIAVKQKGNGDEIISNLEEIINELISDKNRLIQISQAYEEILITQKISRMR